MSQNARRQRTAEGALERREMATSGPLRKGAVEVETVEVQVSDQDKIAFLQADFYDSLRWLFVGAVAWEAAKTSARVEHQAVLGMYTAAVQARALYEFFYGKPNRDDARAKHFVAKVWAPTALYTDYMAPQRPANKRMFHLVYGRDRHSGGSGHDGPDHLKNQIVRFATDLRALSRDFVGSLDPQLRPHGEAALTQAEREAEKAASAYGITNPIV